MSNLPISPITNAPFQVESFYFQIIPIKLILQRQTQEKYDSMKIGVYKNYQPFDETKPFPVNFFEQKQVNLSQFKLNYYAPNYNPQKSLQFTLRLIVVQTSRDKQIGEHTFRANKYINQLKSSQNGAFSQTIELNQHFRLQIELYCQLSRFALQRLIRRIRNPTPNRRTDEVAYYLQKAEQLPQQRIKIKEKIIEDDFQQEDAIQQKREKYQKFSPKKQSLSIASESKNYAQFRREPVISKAPQTKNIPIKPVLSKQKEKLFSKIEAIPQESSEKQIDKGPISSKQINKQAEPEKLEQVKQSATIKAIIAVVFIALICVVFKFIQSSNSTPIEAQIESPSINFTKSTKSKKSSKKSSRNKNKK